MNSAPAWRADPTMSVPFRLALSMMFLATPSVTAQYSYSSSVFRPGESLTYKVKWSIFRLGTITLRQDVADSSFPEYIQVTLDGQSATGLPFISVYFRSTSLLHSTGPTNILYELFSDRSAQERMAYIYDPANSRTLCMALEEGDVVRTDTLDAPTPYYDGSGLLMLVRAASASDTTVSLPTVMDYSMGITEVRFTPNIEMLDIAAYEKPVPGRLFTGNADWKGSSFAGLTGEFKGWVSTDSLRLILRAEVRIFLGSAVIELESISDSPVQDPTEDEKGH